MQTIFGPSASLIGLLSAALIVPLLGGPPPGPGRDGAITLGGFVATIEFGPDGRSLFVDTKGGGVSRVDLGEKGRVVPIPDSLHCSRMLVSPPLRMVVLARGDGRIQLRDTRTLEPLATLEHHVSPVLGLALSADGRTLLSADHAGMVCRWDLDRRELIDEHRVEPGVTCCEIDPGGRRLAVGRQDGTVAIVETRRFSERAGWAAQQISTPIVAVRFSPVLNTLATAGINDRARLWKVGGSWRLRSLLGMPQEAASCLDYTPDGRLLVTGHNDGRIRWWDAASGVPLADAVEVDVRAAAATRVSSLAVSPDGRLLAVASNGAVRLLDVPAGESSLAE